MYVSSMHLEAKDFNFDCVCVCECVCVCVRERERERVDYAIRAVSI